MQIAFYTSYALLWALVTLQAMVLLEVLRRVSRLKRDIFDSMPAVVRDERLKSGTPAPDFAVRELASGKTVRPGDLVGEPSLLLFLDPERVRERFSDRWLRNTLAGLGAKAEGKLYLVCDDSAAIGRLTRGYSLELPVLLDDNGELRQKFRITARPTAVMLDEAVRVKMYGQPHQGLAAELAVAGADSMERSIDPPRLEQEEQES
jgi:hypothetical protein